MTTSWDEEDELCCPSCGVPWNEWNQEEHLADRVLEGMRARESRAIELVKEYWKEHIHAWIDEIGYDLTEDVPSTLWDVWEWMCDNQKFHCDDCNNAIYGDRCFRNMPAEHRAAFKGKTSRKREEEEDEEDKGEEGKRSEKRVKK